MADITVVYKSSQEFLDACERSKGCPFCGCKLLAQDCETDEWTCANCGVER